MRKLERSDVGKRLLLVSQFAPGTVKEITVVEIAPSGDWAKLKEAGGGYYWWNSEGMEIAEELPPAPVPSKPDLMRFMAEQMAGMKKD